MPEYVITHRRSERLGGGSHQLVHDSVRGAVAALTRAPGVNAADIQLQILGGRAIAYVEVDAAVMDEARADFGPDVLVEELVSRTHRSSASNAGAVTAATNLEVRLLGGGSGVARVGVTLVLAPPGVANGITAADGTCRLSYDSATSRPDSVSTGPTAGFWTVVTTAPADVVELKLPSISLDGPCAWWQQRLGLSDYDSTGGSGIRIGIVDTGVGPNACLTHVRALGSIIHGVFDPDGGADVDYHGTSVAGLVAARPSKPGEFTGMAPAAEVVSLRIFQPTGDANQGDVSLAIDKLVDEYDVDLINLSLAGPEPSELEHDAIAHALERGALCLCAAGNDAGAVQYPAAFEAAVAVSALGLTGWGPPGSIASQMTPASPQQVGLDGLFLAPFSSRGPQLSCCAPGLGIVSTYPSADDLPASWAEDSGTSLATPLALAALAIVLAKSPRYAAHDRRDHARSALARSLLDRACRDVGLAWEYQGRGIPQASPSA